jgi:hypothetical protein
MEILQENLLKLIAEKCSSHWQVNVFQDHILINLPDTENDFKSAYREVKKEITACVHEHLPGRNIEVLFEVRNGSWNCSFKLGKTLPELKTEGPLSEKDEQYEAIARAKKPTEEARNKWEQMKNRK